MVERQILITSSDFKAFWKKNGPYRYALTSREYPPVLLNEEEWLFSNDPVTLLKALMKFEKRKMKFVKAPFNPENKKILRPEKLIPWKINHFPEEWNSCVCSCFVPEGHLTESVAALAGGRGEPMDAGQVETAFFDALFQEIESMGYLILKPEGKSKNAAVKKYVEEWEKDEQDAGLL